MTDSADTFIDVSLTMAPGTSDKKRDRNKIEKKKSNSFCRLTVKRQIAALPRIDKQKCNIFFEKNTQLLEWFL